ncbi:MAG: HlyC/CorC family transporter [Deltaproteobacteria bacterium]|nr:HlyC/CorC family transporter [Deltaproteobacteria bacterium]
MTFGLLVLVTTVVLLLGTQALCAAGGAALASADRTRVETDAESGDEGAREALALLADPVRTVACLEVCAILAPLCVAGGLTSLFLLLDAPAAPVWGVAGALLLGVPTEILPRVVGARRADALSCRLAPHLRLVLGVLGPLARLRTCCRPPPGDQVQSLLAGRPDAIDADGRQMIRRVVDLADTTVEEAMVPLIHVEAVGDTVPVRQAAARMVKTGLSRLVVFHERVDATTGVVTHRDLLFASDPDGPVGSVQRRVPHVPETKRAQELLEEFQRDRQRFAVVVDEYGGAVGIITTEDILEEIVGEIEDEHDHEEVLLRRVGERTWIVGAGAGRARLEEGLGLVLPEGDFETLGGFLIARSGQIPAPGTRLTWRAWHFRVQRATDRMVQEVLVRREPPLP